MINICSPVTEQEFKAYFNLRWKILRKAWGLPPGSEKDDLENTAKHFMAVTDNIIIGIARLHLDDSVAVIRYMAVDTPYQRQGIGADLLNHIEREAIKLKATSVRLNARERYINFYLKNSYLDCGAGHTLYNAIKHRKMSKSL